MDEQLRELWHLNRSQTVSVMLTHDTWTCGLRRSGQAFAHSLNNDLGISDAASPGPGTRLGALRERDPLVALRHRNVELRVDQIVVNFGE